MTSFEKNGISIKRPHKHKSYYLSSDGVCVFISSANTFSQVVIVFVREMYMTDTLLDTFFDFLSHFLKKNEKLPTTSDAFDVFNVEFRCFSYNSKYFNWK